jgi:uncharacterized membrane protein YqgA involved in biofilm formation
LTGTLLNVATVLVGGAAGLAFGPRLADRVRQTVMAGIGLFTLAIGLKMFLETSNPIIVLVSLLIGGILGEWWRIEDGLRAIGTALEARVAKGSEGPRSRADFVRGFLTASLLFCVGPMTILGSIQDGLTGDYSLLAVKSVLDGFASLALASTLGIGVLFSIVVILVYQGGITLLASIAQGVFSDAMVSEMTAAGGVLLMALAIGSLLEIRPVRAGNLLPALAIAPLAVWILTLAGLIP